LRRGVGGGYEGRVPQDVIAAVRSLRNRGAKWTTIAARDWRDSNGERIAKSAGSWRAFMHDSAPSETRLEFERRMLGFAD
jgi:hypothetical protein